MNKEWEFGMMNNIEIKKIQRFTDLIVWQQGHKYKGLQ